MLWANNIFAKNVQTLSKLLLLQYFLLLRHTQIESPNSRTNPHLLRIPNYPIPIMFPTFNSIKLNTIIESPTNQQKLRYRTRSQRHVHHRHVEQTPFAVNKTILAHVNACPTTMGIHTMDVDPNVLRTANVQIIWHAWAINVEIHVRACALKTLIAVWLITRRNVIVWSDSPVIH